MGWVMETVICSLREKRFVHRGFLNGPICPIYGVGMVLIIFFLNPFIDNVFILFLLGMIVASILEFSVGYVLEKLFYTRWWDYSQHKFNLKGFICLRISLCWGVLCVVMMRMVQPIIIYIQGLFDVQLLNIFLLISAIILMADLIITVLSLTNFRLEVESIHKLQEKLLEESKVAEQLKTIYENFETNKLNLKQYLSSLSKIASFKEKKYEKHIKRLTRERGFSKAQISRLLNNYALKIKDNGANIIKERNIKDK